MVFNVWDIVGQASMSTVHQCLFIDKPLHVVIWNLALGEEAGANRGQLNIEVNFSALFLSHARTNPN